MYATATSCLPDTIYLAYLLADGSERAIKGLNVVINMLDNHPRNQDIIQSASNTVSQIAPGGCVSQSVLYASLVEFKTLDYEI